MTELKACPFCGGGFEIVKTIFGTYNLVHHTSKSCPVSRNQEFYSEEKAVDLVNTRPFEDALLVRAEKAESELENEKKKYTRILDICSSMFNQIFGKSFEDL